MLLQDRKAKLYFYVWFYPPSHRIQHCTPRLSLLPTSPLPPHHPAPSPAAGAEDGHFALLSWELWTWRYEEQFPKQMVGADVCAPRAQISEKGVVKEENKSWVLERQRKRIREDLKRVLMSKPGLHTLVVGYLLSVCAALIATILSI